MGERRGTRTRNLDFASVSHVDVLEDRHTLHKYR